MEACCGGIVGLGESDDDLIDLAFSLRELDVDSIPVNFLNARPGTPLAASASPSPRRALAALCVFRFVNPSKDIRAAGGREAVLGALAPLALYPANSIFSGGYLTTPGATAGEDARTITALGFEISTEAAVELDR